MKFLDLTKIYLKSGDGGAGSLSFRREKYVEFGGPDGGNGGRGGHVIFKARRDLNTLIDFRYQQHYKAQNGQGGAGRLRSGAKGKDCIVEVPVGTEILDEDQETVLADLNTEGQTLTLLYGGDGGMGNAHYKSSTNRAPRRTTPGFPGEERTVWLRLKLFADVGLVGKPNAGKSTLLASVSAAKPKIADYLFTTLHPNLGVIKMPEQGADFVMADIPGLIENAHKGEGLGDRFLGHIERTAVLLHLIDATEEDIVATYRTIRHELEAYGHGLADKPEMVVLNKTDSLDTNSIDEKINHLKNACPNQKIHAISAIAKTNLQKLLYDALTYVQEFKDNPS